MGHPDKTCCIADILREYERAYFAHNGFEAELRLLKTGRYVMDGTPKHVHGFEPHIFGYEVYELPKMTQNLLDNVNKNSSKKLLMLIKRLMPVRISDVRKTQN